MKKRRYMRYIWMPVQLCVTVLLSSQLLGASSQTATGTECLQRPLSQRPLWLSSAVWVPDKGKIAAIDTLKSNILLIAPSGQADVANLFQSRSQSLPAEIVGSNDGYLLKMFGSPPWALRLDRSFNAVQEITFANRTSPAGVRSVYEWIGAGNDLVGFGTITRPEQNDKDHPYLTGFFRTSANLNGRAEFLLPFDDGDYYVLAHQYVASLGSTAYFILMDASPRIFEAAEGKNPRALTAFPKEYQRAPKLQAPMTGPTDASLLFKEIEGLTIPVGLYGQGKMLYLLTRKPGRSGQTIWSIFQIDPQNDLITGELRLPTGAHHLTVVPAPDTWYFFEKGAVEGVGTQNISSITSIPGPWLTNPTTSPLNAGNLKVRECRLQKK